MNRLSVYSYLTRYATGNTGSDQMFTECVPEKKASRFFVRWLDPRTKLGQSNAAGSQAGRTAFPRSDVGLYPARVR